jgi:hypothetical protein
MNTHDTTTPDAAIPATQVHPKRSYRTFTLDQKRSILAQYDAAPRKQKGTVLREHGLHSSRIPEWRAALSSHVAPRKDPRDLELERLRTELAKETLRARKAEAMLDLQKKVALALESIQQIDSLQSR